MNKINRKLQEIICVNGTWFPSIRDECVPSTCLSGFRDIQKHCYGPATAQNNQSSGRKKRQSSQASTYTRNQAYAVCAANAKAYNISFKANLLSIFSSSDEMYLIDNDAISKPSKHQK